jgi:hypothetical protein
VSRELFYWDWENIAGLAYDVVNGQFIPGKPRIVKLPDRLDSPIGLAPDGRFLIAQFAESPPTPGVRLILNWFEEIRTMLPTSTGR